MNEMSKKDRLLERKRRAERIIFAIGITAVVFVVATYAWFIGTSDAVVNMFQLSVKSGDGLTLSLDGVAYTSQLTITDQIIANLKETEEGEPGSYPSNTNFWTEEGLIPISSAGEVDVTNSVMKMYSKTSISSLTGGFRLRSNLMDETSDDKEGFVVFDLFIKNASGSGYAPTYNHLDDESIYLLGESSVVLSTEGTTGDGIENTVRLAFVQIARTHKEAGASFVQSMTCSDITGSDENVYSDDSVGLCNVTADGFTGTMGLTKNIWEPNDTQHTAAAKNQFESVCKKRTAADTYEGACPTLTWTNNYLPTYVVKTDVDADANVNVYDGHNEYTSSSDYLTTLDTFTDTDKMVHEKEAFFYLAANSITKIRVYIYLEGQDLDNFDLGEYGKKLEIQFGFTKDKYGATPGSTPEGEEGEGGAGTEGTDPEAEPGA